MFVEGDDFVVVNGGDGGSKNKASFLVKLLISAIDAIQPFLKLKSFLF